MAKPLTEEDQRKVAAYSAAGFMGQFRNADSDRNGNLEGTELTSLYGPSATGKLKLNALETRLQQFYYEINTGSSRRTPSPELLLSAHITNTSFMDALRKAHFLPLENDATSKQERAQSASKDTIRIQYSTRTFDACSTLNLDSCKAPPEPELQCFPTSGLPAKIHAKKDCSRVTGVRN